MGPSSCKLTNLTMVSRFLIYLLFLSLASIASGAEPLPAPADRPLKTMMPPELTKESAEGFKVIILSATSRLGDSIDEIARSSGVEGFSSPWLLGISGARYLASLILLMLVCVFTISVVSLIRKNAGRIATGDMNKKSWPKILLTAARKPLALVIWIYGTYFALGILFDAMDPTVAIAFLGEKLTSLTYVGVIIALFWLAFRIIAAVQKMMQHRAAKHEQVVRKILVPVIGNALRSLVLIAGVLILTNTLELPPPIEMFSSKMIAMLVIASVASLIIRAATTAERVLLEANRLDVADNLRAREIYTQVSVIRRIVIICVSVLAVACGLMLFQPVRQLGTSILASAGIAGIVLGLAAQKTLSNLFAGIQIAISQPIRIDDVVIVEGEWGWIEEISLTFVTVRVWDLRRLILPINYFIEKPFQNWTRSSAKLINSFFLHADYTLPVEPLRQELTRLLKANPLWDGDVDCLQVTDSTPTSMEIRCLMTSADAPKGWDLKCEIREGLVRFMQENYPAALPKVRAELHPAESSGAPVA